MWFSDVSPVDLGLIQGKKSIRYNLNTKNNYITEKFQKYNYCNAMQLLLATNESWFTLWGYYL